MAKTPIIYYATGRRKTSTARVRLIPGSGKILINNHAYDQYFGLQTLQLIIKQPLVLTETLAKYDVLARVDGEYRPALKKAGFLTRDPREKERRKYGLKKARKASQYSKR